MNIKKNLLMNKMNKMKFYHSFYVIRNVNEKFQEARKIKISNYEFVY